MALQEIGEVVLAHRSETAAGALLLLPQSRRERRNWTTRSDDQAHDAPARWVRKQIEATATVIALRASTMLIHLEAIPAGTGRGVLTCHVGDGQPLLERLPHRGRAAAKDEG